MSKHPNQLSSAQRYDLWQYLSMANDNLPRLEALSGKTRDEACEYLEERLGFRITPPNLRSALHGIGLPTLIKFALPKRKKVISVPMWVARNAREGVSLSDKLAPIQKEPIDAAPSVAPTHSCPICKAPVEGDECALCIGCQIRKNYDNAVSSPFKTLRKLAMHITALGDLLLTELDRRLEGR